MGARRAAVLVFPLALVLGFTFLAVWKLADRVTRGSGGLVPAVQAETEGCELGKQQLAALMGNRLVSCEKPGLLTAAAGDAALYGQTTIDADLQRYATDLLDKSGSLRGACVILDPDNGHVLALASHNPQSKGNFCLEASPAASLFKIVTATAAIERKHLKPGSRLHYNGDPYRLSRRNLRRKPNRYSTRITLAGAFARSVNPVFGQLGALDLGGEQLLTYGERLGFNHPIPFELELEESHLEVPDDQFGVAKIAAGYNRTTTITPVHAALLAAAVVSGGRMAEPCVLERVVDARLKPLYTPAQATLERPFGVATASELRQLMRATVTQGTCRRSMRRVLGRKWLDRIEIGGKTGSISGDWGRIKYDWFTGYALEKRGERRLAVGVLQVHGEYLGQRSPTIAARVLRHYFGRDEGPVRSASKAHGSRSKAGAS